MSATHNLTKWTRQILRRHSKLPPSMTMHLYANHFRFEQQNGVFLYESPLRCFLEYIREQRLPSELLSVLDEANVKFYEGCLIIQVYDHRNLSNSMPTSDPKSSSFSSSGGNNPNQVEIYRIVLGPSVETLWIDLSLMSASSSTSWTLQSPDQALEVEAQVLNLTQPNLCLDPSFEVTHMANHLLRATTLSCPEAGESDGMAGKRKANQMTPEQEEELERREKMMRFMDDTYGKTFAPTFSRLSAIQRIREEKRKSESKSGQTSKASTSQSQVPLQAQSKPAAPVHPLAQSHTAPSSNSSASFTIPIPSKPQVAANRIEPSAPTPTSSTGPGLKKKVGRPPKNKNSVPSPAESVSGTAARVKKPVPLKKKDAKVGNIAVPQAADVPIMQGNPVVQPSGSHAFEAALNNPSRPIFNPLLTSSSGVSQPPAQAASTFSQPGQQQMPPNTRRPSSSYFNPNTIQQIPIQLQQQLAHMVAQGQAQQLMQWPQFPQQ